MIRYTVHFTGHVQGVGFRYRTRRIAQHYTVAGYVQNLPDGRVRLVGEGEPTELNSFVNAIIDGLGDNITDDSVDKSAANGEFGPPQPGGIAIRN